ncbi:MAG: hypothetical protein ACYDBB_14550 [Armatimonadota bacterium]
MAEQAKSAGVIRYENGRPVIYHNGQPVSQAAYCDYIVWRDWTDRIDEFVESGVQVYYVSTEPVEVAMLWGDPNYERLREPMSYRRPLLEQVEYILSKRPDALFVLRFSSTIPEYWKEAYPDHVQTDESGRKHPEASISSPQYLTDVANYFKNMVKFVEGQPWGDRVVGYLDAPYGEGLLLLACAGNFFDLSPANEASFQAWVREHYASEADLQAAWNDPAVTFNAVCIPKDSEWREKRERGIATLQGKPTEELTTNCQVQSKGLFHWLEEGNATREQDYCRFMRDAFFTKFRTIAHAVKDACAELGVERMMGFDITKQPLMGWPIMSNFDGVGDITTFPNILLLSGSWNTGALLDDPAIDVIFTPADYTARTVGFAYEAEGVTDSMLLRGKTMIIENDARTFVGQGSQEQGAFRTDAEVESGLLRNAALTLSRGIQSYWCNVGSSYFHDARIHKTIAKITPMLDRLNQYPHRETRDAIAMVIDDESLIHENLTSGYQALSVIWQRVLGLAHCGVPYRIFLLSDLEKDAFPAYKTYVFPNLFTVNDRVMGLLKSKVLRDGNLAIFGPATGITDGKVLSAEGATRLLNVPMELIPRTTLRHVIVQDYGHPITEELPASLTYGDRMSYGPTLTPTEWGVENAGGVPLGHANTCWFIHRTGLFLKEEGLGTAGNGKPGARGADDYGVMWSIAMPLPENLLRAAARYAGSNIWNENGDVIYASDSLVSLHSVKKGPRTIKLPRACTVTDAVTNEKLGEGMTEINFTVNPPETRIFTLE